MFVFVCAGCDAELTAPLSEVALPVHARQVFGNGLQLPVLMESGTFAVDPERWGPPWRRWEELDPGEAEARGVYAPVHALSDGPTGAVVIAPGDVRGTRLLPERRGGACCGLDGRDGPNMACLSCGLAVATRLDDCSLWQAVWFAPDAVRRARVEADTASLSWDGLLAEGRSVPPLLPIATWGGRSGTGHFWSWNPQWAAAAGQALAQLLLASEGRPVTVAGELPAQIFQRALDAMLPAGPPERHAVLAGPGRPAPDADILLVPVHPQTGEIWTPVGRPASSAYPVPLPWGVWLWLAFPEPYLPTPMSGVLPQDVIRDEPLPPRPPYVFRVDRTTFHHSLVRLPAVRSPWLREIAESLAQNPWQGRWSGLF